MVTIEQWIRQRSDAAVAAGHGEWLDSPATALGKPIAVLTDGSIRFVMSELGFSYDGPSGVFESRYDDVDLEWLGLLETLIRETRSSF